MGNISMKISTLLIVSLTSFFVGQVSAKEISPLMLSGVADQAFTAHIAMSKTDVTMQYATLADSLRILSVDISMGKAMTMYPDTLPTDRPSIGVEVF